MKNIEKLNFEKQNNYSDKFEYQLAGRYVKNLLEVRTEGRRLHSWDHTLFVAHHALNALNTYHEIEGSQPDDNEEFSLYIASLLHDVIQPNDIRNSDLRKTMEKEWGLDVSGSEYSEGVKAFNYIINDLDNKLSSESPISDKQKDLIEKLIVNKEQILKIYSEKENKDLKKLPWLDRSVASRSLSIADLHGNWNPDMIVKWAAFISSENSKKKSEEKITVDNTADMLISKTLKEGVNRPADDAKPKVHFTYNFFHDPQITNDWKKVLPETMNDYESFIKNIHLLKKEKEALSLHEELKKICEDNGVGVFGMFSFWYKEATEEPRITSQEVFEKFTTFLSEREDIIDIAKEKKLSEDDMNIINQLETNSRKLKEDIKKWQKGLAEAEESLGLKI